MSTYELKFLVNAALAEQIEGWARDQLALDSHADPALDGAYRVRSIYCDTAGLDVYFRNDGYRRRKFRARRYGGENLVHLERKSKPGDVVRKRRTAVAGQELELLVNGGAEPDWPGGWFQRQLSQRGLQPRCLITYIRHAHVGMGHEGPLRLTLDRDIQAALVDSFTFEPRNRNTPIVTDAVVVELKFQATMPALFKELVHEWKLAPTRVSKYRAGIEACGLAGNGTAARAEIAS